MLSKLRRSTLVATLVGAMVLSGGLLSPASADYADRPESSWVPNGTVFAMTQVGDRVYLGGGFTSLRNPVTGARVQRASLAAVDATTGEPVADWNPGANGRVRALAVGPDGTVYAGGDFTEAAGGPASKLIAITPDGQRVAGWDASVTRVVRDIWATDTALYIGGALGRVNGSARPGVARLDPDTGALDKSFNAQVQGGKVNAILPSPDGDTLLLGGAFQAIGGVPRLYVGSVSLATGAVSSWAPDGLCSCGVLDLAADDNNAYAAVGGGGGRVSTFALSSGARLWVKRADGDVQTVAVHDGRVYAGGHYGPTFDGAVRHELAVMNASNGALQGYSLAFTGDDHPGIWAVLVDDSMLRIGGGFRLANSPIMKYAAFSVL